MANSIRGALAVLIAVAALSLLPTGAAALSEVVVRDPVPEGRFPFGGDISFSGDASANRLRAGWSEQHDALVLSAREPIKASRCERLARNAVRCDFAYDDLWIDGDKGRDTLVVGGDVHGYETIFIDGGPAADRIVGSNRQDFITGGDGDDRLDGRGGFDSVIGDFGSVYPRNNQHGDDVLHGGAGRDFVGDGFDTGKDALYGDGGDDELTAKDGSRDRRIDGGRGEDGCSTERQDPQPLNCEDDESIARPVSWLAPLHEPLGELAAATGVVEAQ